MFRFRETESLVAVKVARIGDTNKRTLGSQWGLPLRNWYFRAIITPTTPRASAAGTQLMPRTTCCCFYYLICQQRLRVRILRRAPGDALARYPRNPIIVFIRGSKKFVFFFVKEKKDRILLKHWRSYPRENRLTDTACFQLTLW